MSAMVRLRSGPKRQADLGGSKTISNGNKRKPANANITKPVLRSRTAATSDKPLEESSKRKLGSSITQPPALKRSSKLKDSSKQTQAHGTQKPTLEMKISRKRKLPINDISQETEPPKVNFIMSSPKRQPREALSRLAKTADKQHESPIAAKRRKHTDDGFHSPLPRRIRQPQAGSVQTTTKRVAECNGSSSGASTPAESKDVPPSPLKTMLLSPMSNLWRRVSGLVQGAPSLQESESSSDSDLDANNGPTKALLDSSSEETQQGLMPGSFSRCSSQATDEAGAPVDSPEANSLTAPPMNPTSLGATTGSVTASYLNGMQLYLPESPDGDNSSSTSPVALSYPETPSKENIPVYSDSFAANPDSQSVSVTSITPLTLPGFSVDDDTALYNMDLTAPAAADSDMDLSQVSSVAESELDSQYDAYFDEEDEFNPYLFMANLPPIPKEHTLRPYALPRKTRSCPPITLVLDLDETLVHCALTKVDNADIVFPVEYNGINYDVYCRLRPGYREFLERASALFEVVVFTASQQVYADRLLNLIDPDRKFIRHRLFRDSCVYVNTNYVKDLGILGRDESKMLLVDNCPQAFAYQQSNGVPIESWYEDKSDRELLRLMEFLETLVGVDDVRPLIDAQYKTKDKVIEAKRRCQKRNYPQLSTGSL
ncbi:hypothetical protein IWW36_000707 [Coemansia brasiliensis]|uniref:FCP1 homology domain-containing protein n=1 Tax=Coemansia brasiliensis TaxID=2650707 RepID=A0A9W8M131_9FUNG|nr:hypothetical protein IWW36_000707 [Coemansia brasiliensis]